MTWKDIENLALQVRKDKKRNTNVGPTGLCYAWNFSLAVELKKRGEQPRFIKGQFRTRKGMMDHYFLIVRQRIVDITADQFNRQLSMPVPQVNIGRFRHRYRIMRDETERIEPYF